MLPSTTSNTSSSYTVGHQHYENDTDKDSNSLTTSTPESPNRSISGYSQLNQNSSNNNAGYLSPLSAQHSTVPQVRSPLAMSFNSQGNSNSVAFNTRSSYNTRIRGRRDSFQSSVAFSPTMGHSSPNGSSQMSLGTGPNNLYSSQSRLGYLWPGNGTNIAGGNRNRCLSTSSVDSNASSVGLSHLTPALAAMSVQHAQQQQSSTTSSPYQSYSSSPQKNSFHNQYQQSPSDTYSYGSPFSSPLSQSQVPAYDSLSIAASNIAAGIYGSTPPTHSTTDMMYNSPSHYGSVPTASTNNTQSYNSSTRYSSSSIIPLAPSLYSEPENSNGAYDQYQSQGYYGQQTQQGLGILVAGGMARGMSSSSDNGEDDGQEQSGSKRNSSGSRVLQTADDIRAVIGKDGKTLVYICPKCEPSKVVEFTTKSNLKRHLENENIHNTPYERRRDQKRWQGHEKKQVSRDETTLRMRKWRNCNPEKNRFNDMRCRVYRNARKIYGEGFSEAKEEYIRSEIERRKQNMIIRNSRRAEWANQTANSNNGDSSESPIASPSSASASTSVGFQMQDSAFMFNGYESNSPMMSPAYTNTESSASANESNTKSDKQKPDESKFLQDLKENRLPPRRRSRSAMNAAANADSNLAGTNNGSTVADNSFGALASYGSNLSSDSWNSSNTQQPAMRRLRKQRSASDSADAYRQGSQNFSGTSTLGGYISEPYQSYMDSNQQLQMLEQKYNTVDSVVEAMEISQAINMTSTNNNSTANSGSNGGFYSDRDASVWLNPSAAYNLSNSQQEDGSRGFPFPVIRDRKELARSQGIRLDIPQQHPLAPNQWINGTSADDMVGGSATSLESSALNNHDQSSLANSPLSASLSSPMTGNNKGEESGERDSFSNNGSIQSKSMTKTKGLNFEVFGMPSVPMPLYGQGLSTTDNGFFSTESAPINGENNYLAKDQGVARRHSTAMANLTYL